VGFIIRRDFQVGFSGRILEWGSQWHSLVEFIYRWVSQSDFSCEIVRCDSSSGGVLRWESQVGFSSGIIRWDSQAVFPGGISRWYSQVGCILSQNSQV
jgi:hypothetical protein